MSEIVAWVVDDDESIRWVLDRALSGAGIRATCFANGNELLDAIERAVPDVLLIDIRMPGISGIELLERLDAVECERPPSVIVMTAYSDLDAAVSAYRGGAFEYLPKPFDLDEAIALVNRAACLDRERVTASPVSGEQDSALIGEAPSMQVVFRAIGRLSHSDIAVLVTGESGTGKELVARALHAHSPRAGKAFVAVNASAVPTDLIETELFGHEKGAFTGAVAQRRGCFEQAHGGTLVLDEIGDMPLNLQTHLLRVLQDGQFYRVGGHYPVRVDVRIIAATNQNLETAIEQGRFREDLFYRLNVIRLRVPPLRERRQDIRPLTDFFLKSAARELQTQRKHPSAECVDFLGALDWPGNVRELENLCRWLTVMVPGRDIMPRDLPSELRDRQPVGVLSQRGEIAARADTASSYAMNERRWDEHLAQWIARRLDEGADHLLDEILPPVERAAIEAALKKTRGRRQEAARLLGWGRNTLTRKMKILGVDSQKG